MHTKAKNWIVYIRLSMYHCMHTGSDLDQTGLY